MTDYEQYWQSIPEGKENAVTYDQLSSIWRCCNREVRKMLHALGKNDNGDGTILIRSSHSKGFYRTSDQKEIADYRRECLSRARKVLSPFRKIDRVLSEIPDQTEIAGCLKERRQAAGLTQCMACKLILEDGGNVDAIMLSKMENGLVLPTRALLVKMAKIYGCTPLDLMGNGLLY